MRKILFSITLLFIQIQAGAQTNPNYDFNVTIKGNGQPILFIPGLACSGAVWDQTVEQFQDRFECHQLTLPGFAERAAKPKLDSAYLSTIRDQIIKYIDEELEDEPIVVGHSLGGFTALWLASVKPDLIKKIVIVDSYPFYSAAMYPSATEASSEPQAKMLKSMMVSSSDSIFAIQQKQSMQTMIKDTHHVDQVVNWSLQSDRNTVAQAMYELMTTDLREEVATVEVPILVLGAWYAGRNYGMTSKSVKSNFSKQFELAKDVKVEMAATAGHFIMYDEPQWFFKQLDQFVSQ